MMRVTFKVNEVGDGYLNVDWDKYEFEICEKQLKRKSIGRLVYAKGYGVTTYVPIRATRDEPEGIEEVELGDARSASEVWSVILNAWGKEKIGHAQEWMRCTEWKEAEEYYA